MTTRSSATSLGIRDLRRDTEGDPIDAENGIVISTIRMGYGHYRIAMAGASAARAMGRTPYWLDLLAIPGITQDAINWWNTNYSKYSRVSQRNELFDKYVWESVTSGDKTLPGLNWLLNNQAMGWPWRFLKANARDYRKSELFANLHHALPQDMPILTAHMWNCMGAVAGGMTNVVDMMFDNWPMAFQLTEGATHAVQSPSGYYGFRIMNQFDEDDKILNPTPADAIKYVGHHVDHELVENIEVDCAARLARMRNGEPRRFILTMGGAGAQRELFKAIIDHCRPMIERDELTLFVNLGDHADNWDWLKGELGPAAASVTTHRTWDDAKALRRRDPRRPGARPARVPLRQHVPWRVRDQLPDAGQRRADHQAVASWRSTRSPRSSTPASAPMRRGARSAAPSSATARSRPARSPGRCRRST